MDKKNEDAARSNLPEGWTQEEVELVKLLFPRFKNRDTLLQALGRPHTQVHRLALDIVLKQEKLVKEE